MHINVLRQEGEKTNQTKRKNTRVCSNEHGRKVTVAWPYGHRVCRVGCAGDTPPGTLHVAHARISSVWKTAQQRTAIVAAVGGFFFFPFLSKFLSEGLLLLFSLPSFTPSPLFHTINPST